jgi:hypothetical protein
MHGIVTDKYIQGPYVTMIHSGKVLVPINHPARRLIVIKGMNDAHKLSFDEYEVNKEQYDTLEKGDYFYSPKYNAK